MKEQIEFHTRSGKQFRFALFQGREPLIGRSGNFVYVRLAGAKPEVIYAGETDDLAKHAHDLWAEAQREFGEVALYTRLNISSSQRRREHAELLDAYAPPMNTEQVRRAG